MKLLIKQLIRSVVIGLMIPGMMFSAVDKLPGQFESVPETSIQATQPAQDVPSRETVYIPVLQKDGQVEQMELEAYVCAVVLGEMPASFEMEALKAQAVAARTYGLRCVQDGVHAQNAVCMDHTCCQSYCDPNGYLNAGGKQSNLDRICQAVEETAGEVATYNGKLIFATYFSSAGGMTEDASEVWGRSFPYLKSVQSGEDDAIQKITLSAKVFQTKLGVALSGSPKSWFGKVTYTAAGSVDTMVIGGKIYSGVKIRSLLGLRSTVYTVSTTDSTITFTTKGYGHRVGMSQYGADAMALTGSSYEHILKHYYTGICLEKYPLGAD